MGCSSSKEDDVPGAAADKKTEEGAAQNGKPASESDIVVSMDKGTMDRVKSIFSTWDIDSAGKLELAAALGALPTAQPGDRTWRCGATTAAVHPANGFPSS